MRDIWLAIVLICCAAAASAEPVNLKSCRDATYAGFAGGGDTIACAAEQAIAPVVEAQGLGEHWAQIGMNSTITLRGRDGLPEALVWIEILMHPDRSLPLAEGWVRNAAVLEQSIAALRQGVTARLCSADRREAGYLKAGGRIAVVVTVTNLSAENTVNETLLYLTLDRCEGP